MAALKVCSPVQVESPERSPCSLQLWDVPRSIVCASSAPKASAKLTNPFNQPGTCYFGTDAKTCSR